MKITKEQPPAVYRLELDYTELHALYHLMLDQYRSDRGLVGHELQFFKELREHA